MANKILFSNKKRTKEYKNLKTIRGSSKITHSASQIITYLFIISESLYILCLVHFRKWRLQTHTIVSTFRFRIYEKTQNIRNKIRIMAYIKSGRWWRICPWYRYRAKESGDTSYIFLHQLQQFLFSPTWYSYLHIYMCVHDEVGTLKGTVSWYINNFMFFYHLTHTTSSDPH